jgi:hypothetical protein
MRSTNESKTELYVFDDPELSSSFIQIAIIYNHLEGLEAAR